MVMEEEGGAREGGGRVRPMMTIGSELSVREVIISSHIMQN